MTKIDIKEAITNLQDLDLLYKAQSKIKNQNEINVAVANTEQLIKTIVNKGE